MDSPLRQRRSALAINLGLTSNIILALVKTVFGILGQSSALLADGINSVSDVVYNLVVKIFMKFADKPPDEGHRYGHRQYEHIAAIVVGAFIITTGLTIFGSSVNRTFLIATGREAGERGSLLILGIAVGTIIIKIILTIFTRHLWKLTENPILLAISYDHRNDIFASTGAAGGILLSNLGFPLFDPIAGTVVSVVIVLTGLQIIRETAGNLIGTQPGRELKERIRETATRVPGAEAVEDLVVNRIGPYIVVNLELGVDGNITVSEGNNIAHDLEKKLLEEFEALRGVWIHYHPKNH